MSSLLVFIFIFSSLSHYFPHLLVRCQYLSPTYDTVDWCYGSLCHCWPGWGTDYWAGVCTEKKEREKKLCVLPLYISSHYVHVKCSCFFSFFYIAFIRCVCVCELHRILLAFRIVIRLMIWSARDVSWRRASWSRPWKRTLKIASSFTTTNAWSSMDKKKKLNNKTLHNP